MKDLAGKVAVITGGSSGIGLATGRALAREGMRIVLADLNETRLDVAVQACRDEGFEARGYLADVSKFDSMHQFATAVFQDYGRADLVHLNAGIGALGSFFDDETESWVQTIHVNYLGVVWGIKAFIPRMIDTGDEGMVLATGSPSASEGTTYTAPAYSASKAALMSVMESLYGQLRDRKSSIRVAVAFPLLTATNIGGNPRMMHVASEQQRARGLPTVLVQPDQVAAMIVDGIKHGRFFITMRKQDNDAFFGGAHSEDFFTWREKMVRGRSEAQLNDGTPDSYIW